MLSNVMMVKKHFYVITNSTYLGRDTFKLGKHKGTRESLIRRYQTYFIDPIVLLFKECSNYSEVERDILTLVDKYRIRKTNGKLSELVKMNYADLEEIVIKYFDQNDVEEYLSSESELVVIPPDIQFEGKKCTACSNIKDLTEFSEDKRRADGKKSHCKECMRKHANARNANIREQQARRANMKDNYALGPLIEISKDVILAEDDDEKMLQVLDRYAKLNIPKMIEYARYQLMANENNAIDFRRGDLLHLPEDRHELLWYIIEGVDLGYDYYLIDRKSGGILVVFPDNEMTEEEFEEIMSAVENYTEY